MKKRLQKKLEKMAKPEPRTLTHGYILGDGSFVSAQDFIAKGRVALVKSKSIEAGSTQEETRKVEPETRADWCLIDPPYDADILAKFLEVDEIHARCCMTKTCDAVGRAFVIGQVDDVEVEKNKLLSERNEIQDFITHCNRYDGFQGVFEQACMDHEAIGWGAVEVIRDINMRIRKLAQIPASRIRVMKGWLGFAELTSNDNKPIYYQPFGQKVISKNRVSLDGGPEPFDITKDGDWKNAQWNLRNRETYRASSDIRGSCNEILFVPKYHTKTIYYGVPDIIPAVGYVLANVNIREFFLQFFDYNTIPRYAVIIEGANLDESVVSLIQQYFAKDVRGQSHKTLIIPIPAAAGGEVKVHFEKLGSDQFEGSFETTRASNQKSIMIAHGVSPAIIGIAEAASLGSGKGDAQAENYRERIVAPLQEKWQRIINDLFRLGLGVQHTGIIFDLMSIATRTEIINDDIVLLKQGVVTINEIRARHKLGKPIKGGDRAFAMTMGGPVFLDDLEAPDTKGVLDKLAQEVALLEAKVEEAENPKENKDVASLEASVKV